MEHEEEEKKNPWDYHVKYEREQNKRKEEIYTATLEYFKKSKKAQKYFQKFRPENLQSQIESYAWRKADWIVTRDYREYWNDYRLLTTKNKAEDCLGNIQQKKLFNKQCEWRAEAFTHPAIETSLDFLYWEHNILNCPFIEPITEEDVALYIEYLNTYFGEDLAMFGGWQDYDTYCTNKVTVLGVMYKEELEEAEKEEDEENDDDDDDDHDDDTADGGEQTGRLMPPWYQFWDERRGTGNYRLLTDIRKDKENTYSWLAQEEEKQKHLENFKVNPPDKRKFLHLWSREEVTDFVQKYEKPSQRAEILKGYETNQKLYHNKEESDAMEWVKEAWYDLEDCWEKFPIAPGITDWKEALIQTAKNWEHVKLIRMIPVVYDEYLFRIQTGIAHNYDHKRAAHYRKFADNHKAHILRGREMKGEPRDLNF